MDWSNRVVLDTGASSGIGRGLAFELARRGTAVGLLARRAEVLDEIVNEIEAAGGRALALPADVTDAIAVRDASEKLSSKFGPIDVLFANAGVTPSNADRNAAIAEFNSAANTSDISARARALRDVAENSILNSQEFNRAFVLMQYFGYLRRNPNDPPELTLDYQGYNFWLNKLNSFGGNYVNAEMVKAFLVSSEYRQRFGQ